ncbi:hypothetical protein LOAG_04333 [Loa loa]|uniref:Uncharacterized protein n=1 Tax=Loa loa TaxID=7209 RepID=A0A1S0U491_LOALO|nr:hypothetical protein LOAG_04333 [Loa loa]EFO24154.1 hypothetical protein LOAG_04333 [Loa loa]
MPTALFPLHGKVFQQINAPRPHSRPHRSRAHMHTHTTSPNRYRALITKTGNLNSKGTFEKNSTIPVTARPTSYQPITAIRTRNCNNDNRQIFATTTLRYAHDPRHTTHLNKFTFKINSGRTNFYTFPCAEMDMPCNSGRKREVRMG